MRASTAPAGSAVNAYTINDFCRRNAIGRSTAYELARDGKLRMRKVLGKTIVTAADEAAWLASLEAYQPARPAPRRKRRR
jgi:hypothetical protein